MRFQTRKTRKINRRDHLWSDHLKNGLWKCLLCGAVALTPPLHPTPPEWMPLRYEPLTEDERDMGAQGVA